jgi:6-phosphofructokinase
MPGKNAFYAQSGGPTAVINASACGVLQTARHRSDEINKVYAGRNGIIGALTEDLIDTSIESDAAIAALKHTPRAAFGSCRYKLASISEHRAQYERLIEVWRATGRYDYCVIAVSEGIKGPDGEFLSAGIKDAFGHAQLGGVAPIVTNLIGEKLGYKCHWAVADYLQRSARHIASETDLQQAYAVGRAAVEFAIAGKNAVMPAIRRLSDSPYRWDIIEAPLSEVANQEKLLPAEFISADGFGITAAARRYLAPAHRWRSLSAV